MPDLPSAKNDYAPTSVYDEFFSDEWGTSWLVKGERTPTAATAEAVVRDLEVPDAGARYEVRGRRARIEWRQAEGWWLTCDDEGPYEVWEVEHVG